MNIKFNSLKIECKDSTELIEFPKQINLFYGQMGVGKSTIARLIEYCFGGNPDSTVAIQEELVSVQLNAKIGTYDVILKRMYKSNQIRVMWEDENGESGSTIAPRVSKGRVIHGNKVQSISDMIFWFFSMDPPKVQKIKTKDESKLTPISFRDILWYCYLKQEELDSSFYHLYQPILLPKSREVMKYITGAYSDELLRLGIELDKYNKLKRRKRESSEHLREFMEKHNLSDINKIEEELIDLKSTIEDNNEILTKHRDEYDLEIHFMDGVKNNIKNIDIEISKLDTAIADINYKIGESYELKNELISTSFKIMRSKSAIDVLSNVTFEYCPLCGEGIQKDVGNNVCLLCKKEHIDEKGGEAVFDDRIIKKDIENRISEIEEISNAYYSELKSHNNSLESSHSDKSELEAKLSEELKTYDTKYISKTRELEKENAKYSERIEHLEYMLKMVLDVMNIESEADSYEYKEREIKKEMEEEKGTLSDSEELISKIEQKFHESLLAVGMPDMSEEHVVKINRTTWKPEIYPRGDHSIKMDFKNAGSGGMKTLFNVCYALSLHQILSETELPLPTFLIIDSPSKNINRDIDPQISKKYYEYLYKLALGPMRKTQFIIIDNDDIFSSIDDEEMINKRYMSLEDKEHPRLIPYYPKEP